MSANNCSIFKNTLFGDLKPYKIAPTTTGIIYTNTDGTVTTKQLWSSINLSAFIDGDITDYWKPALISNTSSLIYDKPILGKVPIKNNILGIQRAISFEPLFQNWNMTGDSLMHCDWLISSVANNIEPQYGVLFWYKQHNERTITFKDLPNNLLARCPRDITTIDETDSGPVSRVILEAGSIVKKISDKKVINLSKKRYTFLNRLADSEEMDILHHESRDIIDIPDNTEMYLSYNDNSTIGFDMFIPDGEAFSYYHNNLEKARYNFSSIASFSYLSPGLFPVYRQIYHSLTRRFTRDRLSRKQSMALQKLCYFLATAPQTDRTTVDLLSSSEVYDIVSNYISLNVSSIDSEMTSLKSTISQIMEKYVDLHKNINQQSINNNFIYSKQQLITKLLSKYNANLNITPGTVSRIEYRNPIQTNSIASIGSLNYCSSTAASGDILYNNIDIRLGDIEYSSNLSAARSTFIVKKYNNNAIEQSKEVPLADATLPPIAYQDFYAGGVVPFSWSPGSSSAGNTLETVIEHETWAANNAQMGDNISSNFLWESYGSNNCIKFRDTSKDLNAFGRPIYPPQRRFDTTVNADPMVFVRQNGEYDLKVTKTSYGTWSQIDTVVLSSAGSQIFVPPNISLPAGQLPKVMCNGTKVIAFNRLGLIWLLETDHYRDEGTGTDSDDYGIFGVLRLKDVQINTGSNSPSGVFSLTFRAGNAGVWLSAVELEKMRDDTDKNKNCKSYYQEKIQRIDRSSKMILGSSDFARVSPRSYRFNPRSCGDSSVPEVIFEEPRVSTGYAPKVYGYGSYNLDKINQIGIKMPFHPLPSGDCRISLPNLHSRNRFDLPTPPSSPMYCFPENVEYDGTDIIASPGHFHPSTGWVNNSSLVGKTSVIADVPEQQQTISFRGGGFFNIRPGGYYSSKIYVDSLPINSIDNRINNHYGVGGIDSSSYSNYSSRTFSESSFSPWFNSIFIDTVDKNNICGHQSIQYLAKPSMSGKTIKNIEVKLNHLNYFNPKNLKISLSVSGVRADTGESYVTGVVLLNQEHIDNYQNNFVVTFSDYANKFTIPSKYYNLNPSFCYDNRVLNNYDKILPSTINGISSDIASEDMSYKQRVLGSGIYKLSSIPELNLIGSRFSLDIEVKNFLVNDGKVLDNLSYNDQMSGNTLTRNLPISNVSFNSLCSWELLASFKDIKNTVSDNYINSVDYSLINVTGHNYEYNPTVTGYDYIVNLSNIKHMIPLVNINAPYPSIANINKCSYNDEVLTRSVYTPKAQFPSLIPYLVAGLGFGFGSAVGGMVALAALNSFLGNGGRNDPILNYFIETRLLNQTETTNGQYYKPVYNNKYFGQADRAIVCLSNGGAYWYATEVPIFKYSNTPILANQEYKYIQTTGNLYDLPYKKIVELEDLDIDPLSNNRSPDIGDSSILLNGIRPSFIFSRNERVDFLDKSLSVVGAGSITGINIVDTTSGKHTLLAMTGTGIEEAGFIRKTQRDVVLIYPTGYTGVVENKLFFPSWTTEKTITDTYVDANSIKHESSYSAGSIGWGTSQINPEVLSYIDTGSNNISTHALINNKINDKLINNQFVFISTSGTESITLTGLSGWPTTAEDFGYITHKGRPISTGIHSFSDKATPLFIELRVPPNILHDGSGVLYIENDFITTNRIPIEDGRYWFTIRPDQPCILADELTVKIPTKVELKAVPIVGDLIFDNIIMPPYNVSITGALADRHLISSNGTYTWKMPESKIALEKNRIRSKYGITWPDNNDETFIYGDMDPASGDSKKLLISINDDPKDNLIAIRETFIRPPNTRSLDNKTAGEVLSLGSNLKFRFRNLPRQLKSVDSEDFDKYIYDRKGNLSKGTGSASRARSVGQIANNFVCWKCINPSGNLVEPIAFIKNMNEMYYRGFFGSSDLIEHKGSSMDSQDAWEWIPYEYFVPPCIVTASPLDTKRSINPGSIAMRGGICHIDNNSLYVVATVIIGGDGAEGTEVPVSTDFINSLRRWTRLRYIEDDLLQFSPGGNQDIMEEMLCDGFVMNGSDVSGLEMIDSPVTPLLYSKTKGRRVLRTIRVSKVYKICLDSYIGRSFTLASSMGGEVLFRIPAYDPDLGEGVSTGFRYDGNGGISPCGIFNFYPGNPDDPNTQGTESFLLLKGLTFDIPTVSETLKINPQEEGIMKYSLACCIPADVPKYLHRDYDCVIKVISNKNNCLQDNPCQPHELLVDTRVSLEVRSQDSEESEEDPCAKNGSSIFQIPAHLIDAKIIVYGRNCSPSATIERKEC